MIPPKCSVCLEDKVKELSALPCGHVFHTNCVVEALEHSGECPECKRPSSSDMCLALFFEVEVGAGEGEGEASVAGRSEGAATQGAAAELQVVLAQREHEIDELERQLVEEREMADTLRADVQLLRSQIDAAAQHQGQGYDQEHHFLWPLPLPREIAVEEAVGDEWGEGESDEESDEEESDEEESEEEQLAVLRAQGLNEAPDLPVHVAATPIGNAHNSRACAGDTKILEWSVRNSGNAPCECIALIPIEPNPFRGDKLLIHTQIGNGPQDHVVVWHGPLDPGDEQRVSLQLTAPQVFSGTPETVSALFQPFDPVNHVILGDPWPVCLVVSPAKEADEADEAHLVAQLEALGLIEDRDLGLELLRENGNNVEVVAAMLLQQ